MYILLDVLTRQVTSAVKQTNLVRCIYHDHKETVLAVSYWMYNGVVHQSPSESATQLAIEQQGVKQYDNTSLGT